MNTQKRKRLPAFLIRPWNWTKRKGLYILFMFGLYRYDPKLLHITFTSGQLTAQQLYYRLHLDDVDEFVKYHEGHALRLQEIMESLPSRSQRTVQKRARLSQLDRLIPNLRDECLKIQKKMNVVKRIDDE